MLSIVTNIYFDKNYLLFLVVKVKNHLLQFGGTGFPFGSTNTNCLYDLNLDTLEWKVLLQPTDPEENEEEDRSVPRAKYGHVCVHSISVLCNTLCPRIIAHSRF